MPGKFIRLLLLALALIAGITAAACGTVATPEWAAEALATQTAQAATSQHLTAIAPTATPIPPTETPVPPTPTPLPPTETSIPPTETLVPPTATMAMDMPTEEASSGAAGDLVAAVEAADPANGQVVFNTQHNTDKGPWACATCHSVTPNELRVVGPGLWNVSVHGPMHALGMTEEDMSHAEMSTTPADAIAYIHQSIVDPNAVIAPGDPPFPPDLMPQNWEQVLTPQELNDVIAYLMTLHD